jgi:hypothetical protein
MSKVAQGRYKPSPKWNGRKAHRGFVCGPGTWADTAWCVAVKRNKKTVQVRDTKDMTNTTLSFTKKEWQVFVQGIKDGSFDV